MSIDQMPNYGDPDMSRREELTRVVTWLTLSVDARAKPKSFYEATGLKGASVRVALRRGYFSDNQVDAILKTFGEDRKLRAILRRQLGQRVGGVREQ